MVQALSKLSNVEELYEVTGEFDVVTLVSVADVDGIREFLKNKVLKIKGIRSTVTSIVFNAPKSPRKATDEETEP